MGKSKGNSENWLVTYADLMSLLLVFFVLLYALTPNIEEGVFENFISYFQSTSGFFDANNMRKEDYETPAQQNTDEVLEARQEYWEAFIDVLEEHEMSSEIEAEMLSNGVKITLSDSLTFESGSSELLPLAEDVLMEVAKKIDNRITEIEVQGHTDNVPIRGNNFYRSNWHLGAARAVSVVQYLQNNSDVEPKRFKASSYGEYNPVAENETAEGRRRNRRVEIYLTDILMEGESIEL